MKNKIKREVDFTETFEQIKKIADKENEGNFSLTVRKIINLGLSHHKNILRRNKQ